MKKLKTVVSTVNLALCLGLMAAGTVLSVTGCAGDRYTRSTGEYIDDKSVNSRIHSALADNPEYKFEDVKISSFKGTVQLSGFVQTDGQKTTAGQIAKGVQGVKNVENNITIKDGTTTAGQDVDDKALSSQVDEALENNPEYKYEEVEVTTLKGSVQLSGFVNTAAQKSKAGDLAKHVTGVKEVLNNITVKDNL